MNAAAKRLTSFNDTHDRETLILKQYEHSSGRDHVAYASAFTMNPDGFCFIQNAEVHGGENWFHKFETTCLFTSDLQKILDFVNERTDNAG